MPFSATDGTFSITTDATRLDNDVVESFLRRSYWAPDRPRDQIDRSIHNSLCFGLLDGEALIGFARVITDYATFAWLCDVFVLEEYRGRELGKWLIRTVLAHPDLGGVRRWMLATASAHELYRQFGFAPLSKPEKWMERFSPEPVMKI